jgi:hypothetical protein
MVVAGLPLVAVIEEVRFALVNPVVEALSLPKVGAAPPVVKVCTGVEDPVPLPLRAKAW